MEQLKSMKDSLMAVAQSQMGNLENVNAKELGEVMDMIKDLAEAEYYCSITKAMEDSKKDREDQDKIDMAVSSLTRDRDYYGSRYYDPRYENNRMYYSGNMMRRGYDSNGNGMPSSMVHDYRDGRSYSSRRGYMKSKEMHADTPTMMHKLEKYIDELAKDITEMTRDSSQDEKQMLRDKLNTLSQNIV